MKPENDLERQIYAETVIADVLAYRVQSDHLLVGMVRTLAAGHAASGTEMPRPFDGRDSTEELPILLASALVHVQKLLFEVPARNRRADGSRPKPSHVLAESKIRELDVALQVALKAAIDVHLLLKGAS